MSDVASTKEEYPIGRPSSVSKEKINSKEHMGPLLSVKLEYSQLPDSFEVGNSIIDGFELLRKETLERKVEMGGLLFRHSGSEIRLLAIKQNKSNSKGMVGIGFHSLDINNIEGELRRSQYIEGHPERDIFRTQVYFVDSNTAQHYMHFFEKLVRDGKEIIIDGTPIAPVHTHPSGNLPSQGDFAHVVWGPPDISRPEIVVTSDWAYFLIPTKQTPDVSRDPSSKFNLADLKGMEEREYEEETSVANHLIASSGKDGEQGERNAINAVRLKMLQDNCVKYSVGFYGLEKGKSLTTRIV